MLAALASYASTAHAGIPPDSAGCRASVRVQTSLTEDQRALPRYSQRLSESNQRVLCPSGEVGSTPPQALPRLPATLRGKSSMIMASVTR
jgi:hypothetical protein